MWHNKQNSTFHSSWIAHYKYPRDLICWLFAKMYWVPVVDAIDAPLRSPLPASMCILQLLKVLQLRALHLWPSRCHLFWRYMEVFTAWPSRPMTEWFMGVQQTGPLASKWDNCCVVCALETRGSVQTACYLRPHRCSASSLCLSCFPCSLTGFSWRACPQ